MKKAVFFDLDGVLIDSVGFWHGLFNAALERYGKEPLSKEQFIQEAWGISTKDNRIKFFPDVTLEQLIEFYREHFLEHIAKVKLFPAVIPLLRQLKERKLIIVLITNSHSYMLGDVLKTLGIYEFFDRIASFDGIVQPKPHPMMLLQAMDAFKLKPEDVLFVGDTETDMQAGRRAGIETVGVGIMGDRKIDKLEEILKILDKT